jgi:Xaa-Pro dipeptidase
VDAVFAARLTRLRTHLAEAGADAVLLWPSDNWRYLTPVVPVAAERLFVLVATADQLAVIAPAFDVAEVSEAFPDATVFGWSDQDGPGSAVAAAAAHLDADRFRSVCVDDTLPFSAVAALRSHFDVSTFGMLSRTLPRHRLIKDAAELDAIAACALVIEAALARIPGFLVEGMTETQLAARLRDAMYEAGASTANFGLVQFGANSANPHHLAGSTQLAPNTNILIDTAIAHHGYFADISRNFFFGTPGPRYEQIFEVVRQAQAAGVAAIRPGALVADVDRACRDVITAAGFGDAFTTRTGHGIGLNVHEEPSVTSTATTLLEPGMVITVEPGIYLAGEFGARIEDTVAVTADGSSRLSASSRDLVRSAGQGARAMPSREGRT